MVISDANRPWTRPNFLWLSNVRFELLTTSQRWLLKTTMQELPCLNTVLLALALAGAQEMRVQVETKSNNIPLKLLLVIEIVHFIVKFALNIKITTNIFHFCEEFISILIYFTFSIVLQLPNNDQTYIPTNSVIILDCLRPVKFKSSW